MKNKIVKVQYPKNMASNKRRQFLKLSGMAIAGSGILMACSNDDNPIFEPQSKVFDLGKGDLGVLNYAYALEQLEADFYTKVVNGSYWSSASEIEKQLFQDLYNHEINHRDFFSVAISAAVGDNTEAKLPTLEFDYGDIDFNNRKSVLDTAKLLEDTGVAAYNGAGFLITDPTYLLIAGKIVSVEARHAAAIRSIINPGSVDFAGDDIIKENGLDLAKLPSEILAAAGGFIVTPFTANSLP